MLMTETESAPQITMLPASAPLVVVEGYTGSTHTFTPSSLQADEGQLMKEQLMITFVSQASSSVVDNAARLACMVLCEAGRHDATLLQLHVAHDRSY